MSSPLRTAAPAGQRHAATRLRAAALLQLWAHRSCWRLPLPRALMQRERDSQLAALMPAVLLVALMAGSLLFVTLASTLQDSYLAAMATLWPVWVIQAAPLVAAQLLAMRRSPTLALELAQRQAQGEFAALRQLRATPAAYPCVPLLVAHVWVVAAANFLIIAFTLLAGFAGAFVFAIGDLRQTADAVFGLVSPLGWLRSLLTALVLGLACSLAAMLYAWPGTQGSAAAGVYAHRLGLRAMMLSSAAVITAALALNWLMNLLGFLAWR